MPSAIKKYTEKPARPEAVSALTKAELRQKVNLLQDELESRSRELHEAKVQLARSERLSVLGKLTATVGHEIRNPLGVMQTSIYLIEHRATGLDQTLRKAIDRIKQSIGRCDSIVHELLDFSRGINVDLTSTQVDHWLGLLLDEQNIPESVTVEFRRGLGERLVSLDQDRLRRAVINVVENAIQAVGEADAPGTVTVDTLPAGDDFEIRISDTGPGIPPDDRVRVFEPLFSTRASGIGLGLAVTREIVMQHGGSIGVEDNPGGGACFVIRLPVAGVTL